MENLNTQQLYSTLPYNLEAEQSVLGSVLIDPSCLPRVMEHLKPESFYRPQHKEIFSIYLQMFISSKSIDFITVLDEVKKESVFRSEEDAKIYLLQLAQIVPSTANVEEYARIVREKSYIRRLIESSNEIIELARNEDADAANLLDMAEQSIFDIRKGKETTGLVKIDEIITETYDQFQKLSSDDKSEYMGISTGFSALDQVITGLNKSDFLLVAARPAMGKTSFALNIATNVALKANKTVAIFSLEMSKEQLVTRMLSAESLIQYQSLRKGELTSNDWVKLGMAAQILCKAPIYIDDTPGITIGQMKGKLRRIKNLGIVIIDYLQLMTGSRKSENRVQEVSEITRSLKIMAKELNVPVMTLSQLSRGPESRTDHRPMLSDLRESGSIEQDADIVMFLYRDAYYNPDTEDQNIAEVIVAKNRHGETDNVKMGWDGQFTRFKSLELYKSEQ
ncbi:MAG: replicative DNA helicase [Oscillospiraceae bacterium]